MKFLASLVGLCLIGTASRAWEQILLPHAHLTADAQRKESPVDQRREDIRDQRIQQQGLGAHDRTGGESTKSLQGTDGEDSGRAARTSPQVRQDAGQLDPTAVNPGQAAGTQNR